MSGGIDSSIAAILLKEQGYQVVGVTFGFWGENTKHADDAAAMASIIGIEHYSIDLRERFKTTIVDYFVEEYIGGRTPFPCAKCNNELKWTVIFEEAERLGCDFVAMGHYVEIVQHNGKNYKREARDPDKDQSFFLWGLSSQQIARIVFPLSKFYKTEVRAMARERNLSIVSDKKDSLGACFCEGDYRPFLQKQLADPKRWIYEGNFVDTDGNVLGKHNGYPLYTVGQRRGLIHLNRAVFVKEIRPQSNEVVLASLNDMYRTSFNIHSMRYIDKADFEGELIVKIRYRKQSNRCRVIFETETAAQVQLNEPLESIAPGQTAVFYVDGRVIGGGFIQ